MDLTERESKGMVRSVEKALRVLDLVAKLGKVHLGEVCRDIGMHKTTAYRFLSTLEDLGYLRGVGEQKGYELGLKAFELAVTIYQRCDIVKLARPYMDRLAGASRETTNLAILDGTEILYLDKRESPEPLTVTARVGERKPAHLTALGKALLAFRPEEERALLLSEIQRSQAMARPMEEFMLELQDVMNTQVAYDKEELIPGVFCMAAPVCDPKGNAEVAISITIPTARVGEQRLMELKALLVDVAHDFSKQLAWALDKQSAHK